MRFFSIKIKALDIHLRTYHLAAILLVGFKYVLVSAQHMSPLTQFVIDDGLFIDQAYHIINGLWLGEFNNLTLSKGCIYPVFISLVNTIGLPLLTGQLLLYVLAAHVVVRALAPVLKNRYLQILLFAIVLFNPMLSQAFTTQVLRDSFYASVSLLMIAGFVGMYLRRHSKSKDLVYWAVFTGIMLFAQQNTREEGLTFLPVLLLISIVTLFSGVMPKKIFQRSGLIKIENRVKKAVVVILPYALLVLGNTAIASVNYYHYGCFIRNDIREGSFPQAYGALTKIKSNILIDRVPVPKEARMKAYAVSPAFSELREFLDGEKRLELNVPGSDNSDILGGFLIWGIKRAVTESGHGGSLVETQHFYQRIADEINLAFDQGKLEKKNNLSFSGFSFDFKQVRPVFKVFTRAVALTVGFEEYSPYPVFFKADMQGIKRFEYITNESALFGPAIPDDYQIPSKIKFMILNFIAQIFHWINPVVAAIALLSFLFITVYLFIDKNRYIILDTWLISLFFLLPTVIRIGLMSYMEALQWPGALAPRYVALAYPYMLIFEFLVLYQLFGFIKSNIRRNAVVNNIT